MKGLFEKRGWYYFQPPTPKGGKRPGMIALRTMDYVEAVIAATKIRDENELVCAARRDTLEEVLPKYYHAKRHDTKATRRSRETILDGFKDLLGNPRVDALCEELVGRWQDHLGTKGATPAGRGPLSPAAKKTCLITVRAFTNWLKKEGMLRIDPMAAMKRQTKVNVTRIHEYLTIEERDKVLGAMEEMHRGRPVKDDVKLILLLGCYAGLRDTEILAANPAWLWIADDHSQGTIRVQDTPIVFENGVRGMWQPKGKRRREIPMHPRLLAWFKDHPPQRPWLVAPHKEKWPGDEKVSKRFEAKNALHGLAKRAGISKLNFHILRRSFATHLVMKGVGIREVAALLGDRLSVTEDNYAGFIPSRRNPLEGL